MYLITYTNIDGSTSYLRGTVWTSYKDRAFTYDTLEQAEAAINKAMQFMKKSQRKNIKIVY